jgi:hypothetical protein
VEVLEEQIQDLNLQRVLKEHQEVLVLQLILQVQVFNEQLAVLEGAKVQKVETVVLVEGAEAVAHLELQVMVQQTQALEVEAVVLAVQVVMVEKD